MPASRVEADVVVVGGGGAALAAASSARSAGAEVILLEKNPQLGGSTAWSVGSVTATQTPHQRRAGITDNPQDHLEDLKLFSAALGLSHRDNFELGRVLCDHTPAMFEWLLSTGLEFVGPFPEPPHRRPRMHNVLPNSRAFPYLLGRHCYSQGVDIRASTEAQRLIMDNGRARGVVAREPSGASCEYMARKGVVLAAGDYSGGRELKARFASEWIANVDAVNVTNTGDGIRMGLENGGRVINGDYIRGPILRFVPPMHSTLEQRLPPLPVITKLLHWGFDHLPKRILRPVLMNYLTTALAPEKSLYQHGAILVDRDGLRFGDERDQPARGAALRPEGLAWMIFDSTVADRYQQWPHFISTAPSIGYAYLEDYRRTRKDIFRCAATLGELADCTKLPHAAFEKTLAHYNAGVSNADSPARGDRPAIVKPPFYALGPAKAYIIFTNGGLKVTLNLEVVGRDEHIIPGLYAAGANGQGGMLLEGHGHHLGWAFVSGQLAGRNAAFHNA
ncbi:MAG TPA: FAD-dependent oxidoreductase [Burkholderiales bacterium]|nr:FAD-dependent oxidoreductase [Burkholderiales bacterium]